MSDRADPFAIVVDANVLAGALTRNIILSLAEAGFFRPYWSFRILDEFERYCAKRTGSAQNAKKQRLRIEAAFQIEGGVLQLERPDSCPHSILIRSP